MGIGIGCEQVCQDLHGETVDFFLQILFLFRRGWVFPDSGKIVERRKPQLNLLTMTVNYGRPKSIKVQNQNHGGL